MSRVSDRGYATPQQITAQLELDVQHSADVKAEMTRLLDTLERAATGGQTTKPGGWRHHPIDWAKAHLS